MQSFLCVCWELRQNSNFLLNDNCNQVDEPEDTEEVSGNELKNTNYDSYYIASCDTCECSVNIVEDYEKKLNDPRKSLKSLFEFCHSISPPVRVIKMYVRKKFS